MYDYILREIFIAFRSKIIKEIKLLCMKVVDKYQEKSFLRKSKHDKNILEKYHKERIARYKLIQEIVNKYWLPLILKVYNKIEMELSKWCKNIYERLRIGEDEFRKYIMNSSNSGGNSGSSSGTSTNTANKNFIINNTNNTSLCVLDKSLSNKGTLLQQWFYYKYIEEKSLSRSNYNEVPVSISSNTPNVTPTNIHTGTSVSPIPSYISMKYGLHHPMNASISYVDVMEECINYFAYG